MKQINGIGSLAVMDAQLARAGRNGSTSTSTTHLIVTMTSTLADSAQLSTTARLIRQNAGAADVRYEKVASIKAAIDAGTYSVPAAAVADRLIESMFA